MSPVHFPLWRGKSYTNFHVAKFGSMECGGSTPLWILWIVADPSSPTNARSQCGQVVGCGIDARSKHLKRRRDALPRIVIPARGGEDALAFSALPWYSANPNEF
jgi:hypothetical protein